jgi:sugar phosphate isomerase/epimerase
MTLDSRHSRRAFLETLGSLTAGALCVPHLSASATPAGDTASTPVHSLPPRATQDATSALGSASKRVPPPNIAFPTAPRDRISVASYPFRAYINAPNNKDRDNNLPGMTLSDFPAHVVEKFGVHNIEPLDEHFPSLEPAQLDAFRAVLETTGVRAVNIPIGNDHSFYDSDPAARQAAVAYAKQWVDAAVRIGSPGIRAHIRRATNSAPNVDRAAMSLHHLADYAAEKNVVVTLENDDLVSEDARFIVQTIFSVNHPYLRALPDFANSMLSGNADFNYQSLKAMFLNAYNICHVKAGETDEQGKPFTIDMQKSFDILNAANYRGYCSMEYDAPGDPYPPTTQLIEQTLKYLA